EFVRADDLLSGAIVVECGEIDDCLSQSRAKINVVEGPDNGRKRETGNRRADPEARCPKVGLLRRLGHCAGDVWKHGAAANSVQTARLPQHFVQSYRAEIVSKPPLDRIPHRKLAIEGKCGCTRRAS